MNSISGDRKMPQGQLSQASSSKKINTGMKHHPTIPVPVHLPINRAAIGAHRAALVYQGCRSAAKKLDPQFHVQGDYDGCKHVGWTFTVKDRLTAVRLRLCFDALMAGRPLPLPQ